MQSQDGSITKSKICKLLGVPNSRSFFSEILNGRELTPTFEERLLSSVLDINMDEEAYFRVLVKYNQCQNSLDRSLLFDKLVELNKTPKKILDKKLYGYYRSWQHSTIRAHLDIHNLKKNYSEFAKHIHPPLSGKQVRESIQLMARLGLIDQDENGNWKPSHPAISSDSNIKNEMVKHYTAQCFELGKNSIYEEIGQKRNLSTMTLSMSEKTLHKILSKLQTFKSEIRSIVNKEKDPADRVYQFNFQLFPQSTLGEKSK